MPRTGRYHAAESITALAEARTANLRLIDALQ